MPPKPACWTAVYATQIEQDLAWTQWHVEQGHIVSEGRWVNNKPMRILTPEEMPTMKPKKLWGPEVKLTRKEAAKIKAQGNPWPMAEE